MINISDLNLMKSSEEKASLTARLNQMALERVAEKIKQSSGEKEKEDPAKAVLKAYLALDKEMMKVMDEHIERVRKSSERNKELYRKLSLKKEFEKLARMRKEHFDEAAEKVEEQRKLQITNKRQKQRLDVWAT